MGILWTVTDRFGHPVSLTEDRLRHIIERHAEMEPLIDSLPNAVANAEVIDRDPKFSNRRRHYWHVPGDKRRIRVVVHYTPTPVGWIGSVVTAHLYKRGLPEERIWP